MKVKFVALKYSGHKPRIKIYEDFTAVMMMMMMTFLWVLAPFKLVGTCHVPTHQDSEKKNNIITQRILYFSNIYFLSQSIHKRI